MKRIKLTQGKVALVDDADYKWLNRWRWYARKGRSSFYVTRSIGNRPNNTMMQMHRIIMKAKKGQEIDHRDGNGLNNQKSNLRFCTHGQNKMNCVKKVNSSSKYKGVYWHQPSGKWIARINLNKKRFHLGSFDSEYKAACVYDEKAKELFKEFAKPNF